MDKKGRLWNGKGEHIISVDSKGVWRKTDDGKAWISIGLLVHGICNVWEIIGLVDYNTEKYVPVAEDFFKYREALKIKSIRRCFQKNRMSSAGPFTKISYGYIKRDQLKNLLHKRKVLRDRPQGVPVVLTKISDWEMHSK